MTYASMVSGELSSRASFVEWMKAKHGIVYSHQAQMYVSSKYPFPFAVHPDVIEAVGGGNLYSVMSLIEGMIGTQLVAYERSAPDVEVLIEQKAVECHWAITSRRRFR